MNRLQKLTMRFYLIALCRGLVFWYSIEKLFEASIGFNATLIIVLGMVAQVSVVLFEIPSSVFADRVSRKHTLMMANGAFIISALLLGASSTFWLYAAGLVVWAASDALTSGVYEAFVYDSLIQHKQESMYRKIMSRMVTVELLALAVVGVLASVVGERFGLKANFFLSVISPVVAIFLLSRMQEPPISRTSEIGLTWIRHLHEGFKVITRPVVVWAAIGMVLINGLLTVWYEYYQLIAIEVNIPQAIFGASIAFLTLGLIGGSLYAHRYKASYKSILTIWLLFGLANIAIVFASGYVPALFVMFAAAVSLRAIELYFEVYIQEHIPSSQRATAISLVSTVGHMYFFFLGLAFIGLVSNFSVRTTFFIMAIPLMMFAVISSRHKFKSYIS